MKFGIVSLAHMHAYSYASQILESGNQITGVWDEDEEQGNSFSKKYNTHYYSKLEDLLSSTEVEAVIITSPTSEHYQHIKLALEHNKHVLCEKPMCTNVAEGKKIVELVNSSAPKFMMSFPSRLDPGNILMKNLIYQGIIGDVLELKVRVAHSAAIDGWFEKNSWFINSTKSGGGGFFDLGVHGADLMRWLIGEIKKVHGLVVNLTKRYEVDDHGFSIMKFSNGALGILEAGWTQSYGYNPIEVYGSLGFIFKSSSPELNLKAYSKKLNSWIVPDFPRERETVIQRFVDFVNGKKETLASVEDGYKATEIIQATYISSNFDSRTVNVPL
ncbi:MAG: Gfo/Idh/MocA family oxidoreductase [Candidatus Brockarchaeota archaeon]|nr:Gfo/Idh/MocA family oxidoreductase [Candidatus Brockarchaeota archaeon]